MSARIAGARLRWLARIVEWPLVGPLIARLAVLHLCRLLEPRP
jgi:hypothetical protein